MYDQESLKKYIDYWTPRCRDNFSLFCEKMLGIKLNKAQTRIEHIMATDGQWCPVTMILFGNRAGKTIYEALKHIYKNYYKLLGPGKTVSPEFWQHLEYKTFNSAPSMMNTRVILETILQICRGQLPILQPDGTYKTNDSKLIWFVDSGKIKNYEKIPDQGPFWIHFANGSKFLAITMGQSHGDVFQGMSFMFGTYDEFGRSKNPDKEIDDIIPRLAQFKGELEIITTPDIENEEAISYIIDKKDKIELSEINWRLIEGSTSENEYVDVKDLEVATQGMSEDKKHQILHGGISLKGASYFETANVVKMFDGTAKLSLYGIPGRRYSVGLDTAGGGKDYWAINVLDITDPDHWHRVFYYYDKLNQPGFNIGYTKTILDRFHKAGYENVDFTMDKTNEAGSIYYNEFANYNVRGFRFGMEKGTGKNTKADLLDVVRRAINENDLIKCTDDRMLRNQIVSYKGPMDDKKQTTDALMSFALSVYYPYKQRLDGMNDICIDL